MDHPYLEGVKCREDGAVWIPQSGSNKAHWTFGSSHTDGYRPVMISRKHYLVHRLICEAFHGLCPEDKCQVDHINRIKDDNRPENLRWVDFRENNRNTTAHETSVAKYGVSAADDINAYNRAHYANNPEERERRRAYHLTRRAKKKEVLNNQP